MAERKLLVTRRSFSKLNKVVCIRINTFHLYEYIGQTMLGSILQCYWPINIALLFDHTRHVNVELRHKFIPTMLNSLWGFARDGSECWTIKKVLLHTVVPI